jgi:hypothetical protein
MVLHFYIELWGNKESIAKMRRHCARISGLENFSSIPPPVEGVATGQGAATA